MMSGGEQLLLSIMDSEGEGCRRDRRRQKTSMIFCHQCVDRNIELPNGNRSCLRVRFPIDVRRELHFSTLAVAAVWAFADSIAGVTS